MEPMMHAGFFHPSKHPKIHLSSNPPEPFMKTDIASTQPFNTESPEVRVIASPKSWIESEAVRQLYAVAKFEGVRLAVGFPDLHPGKGTPVGAAFVTDEIIYPHVIGGDIGCGM